MTGLNELHFLRPGWLLAILPLVGLIVFLYRRTLIDNSWHRVCDAALLPFILETRTGKRRKGSITLIAWCGLCLILALAGPAWERLPTPLTRAVSSLVIVVDLSRSMDAGDLVPSRIDRARYKIADLLRLREEGQTALVIYAAEAFTVVPLSDDVRTIHAQLSALSTSLPPTQGKVPAQGLKQAKLLLQQAGVAGGHVLLVSDGVDTAGSDAARRLAAAGHRVSVLAVGTRSGAPVALPEGGFLKDEQGAILFPETDHTALRALALAGAGRYTALQIGNDTDVQGLQAFFTADAEFAEAEDAMDQDGPQADSWQDQGHWLALLVLPFAALAFRHGVIGIALCPVLLLPYPGTTQAADWRDLWQNTARKAWHRFQADEYQEAARDFSDPRWQAASHYRNKNYAAALEAMENPISTADWYNRGNVLAKLGRYEEAMAAYEAALAINPQYEDAGYNRDQVAEALRKQEGQKQADGQGQEGESGEDGKSESANGEQQGADHSRPEDTQAQDGQSGAGTQSTQAGQEDTTPPPEQGQEQKEMETAQAEKTPSNTPKSGEGSEKESDQDELSKQNTWVGEEDEQGSQEVENSEDGDTEKQTARLLQTERQQAMEQWLRRIPDDSAELLRRKFHYQAQQRRR